MSISIRIMQIGNSVSHKMLGALLVSLGVAKAVFSENVADLQIPAVVYWMVALLEFGVGVAALLGTRTQAPAVWLGLCLGFSGVVWELAAPPGSRCGCLGASVLMPQNGHVAISCAVGLLACIVGWTKTESARQGRESGEAVRNGLE